MPASYRVRLGGALLGLLALAVVCLAEAPKAKETVADVIPQGNHNVPTQKIMATIKTRPGSEYNRHVIDEDVRALWRTNAFDRIEVDEEHTDKGVIVRFRFRESPTLVREVVYDGAKHLKPDELDSVTGLRKGVPLNPVANRMAKQAIIRKYKEEGRPLTTVKLVEGGKPGDSRVVFRITEGPICRLTAVEITGCEFVSEARLKAEICSSDGLPHRPCTGRYNPIMADEDVNKLLEYYRGFGFHDVTVTREVQYLEPGRVKLVFHVHEGQRYRVGAVDLPGIKSLSPDQIYNQGQVDTDKKVIQSCPSCGAIKFASAVQPTNPPTSGQVSPPCLPPCLWAISSLSVEAQNSSEAKLLEQLEQLRRRIADLEAQLPSAERAALAQYAHNYDASTRYFEIGTSRRVIDVEHVQRAYEETDRSLGALLEEAAALRKQLRSAAPAGPFSDRPADTQQARPESLWDFVRTVLPTPWFRQGTVCGQD